MQYKSYALDKHMHKYIALTEFKKIPVHQTK